MKITLWGLVLFTKDSVQLQVDRLTITDANVANIKIQINQQFKIHKQNTSCFFGSVTKNLYSVNKQVFFLVGHFQFHESFSNTYKSRRENVETKKVFYFSLLSLFCISRILVSFRFHIFSSVRIHSSKKSRGPMQLRTCMWNLFRSNLSENIKCDVSK